MNWVKQMFSMLLVTAVALAYTTQVQAFGMERYVEGTHYKKLDKAPHQDKTVVEYFSYGCPHCNHLEPALEAWLEHMPAGVEFSRVPAIWNSQFQVLAQLYYSLDAIGQQQKLTPKVFDYLHNQKKTIRNQQDAAQFVADQGADVKAFNKAWKSEQVKQSLIKASEDFINHDVRGVPAIVVNGQYQTSVSMAGSNKGLFEIVEFLLAK